MNWDKGRNTGGEIGESTGRGMRESTGGGMGESTGEGMGGLWETEWERVREGECERGQREVRGRKNRFRNHKRNLRFPPWPGGGHGIIFT